MATATRDATPTGTSAWLVRGMLLVAALFMFRWAQGSFLDFQRASAAKFRFDLGGLAGVMALFVLAGLAFGLSIRYPFSGARFAWSRLVFSAIALVPAAHLWLVLSGTADGLLGRQFWFDGFAMVQIGAVLAGVAIASGVGARPARR
jgi:hypothetical protein